MFDHFTIFIYLYIKSLGFVFFFLYIIIFYFEHMVTILYPFILQYPKNILLQLYLHDLSLGKHDFVLLPKIEYPQFA